MWFYSILFDIPVSEKKQRNSTLYNLYAQSKKFNTFFDCIS